MNDEIDRALVTQVQVALYRASEGELEAPDEEMRAALVPALSIIHGLRAEVEALRDDAERYRWLRDQNNMRAREIVRYYGDVEPTELDAAIDAARKEAPRG